MDTLVSIIIPHWNGIDVLSECIDSLNNTKYSNFEIIVVDNASSDDSVKWINNNHPNIIIVENDQNYGYAGGCNRGIKISQGEYIVFLNNDTIVTPDFISEMIPIIEKDDKIAICQSLLLKPDKSIDSSGDFIDHLGVVYNSTTKINDVRKISSARGASMLIRKKIFGILEGFDEKFFVSENAWRWSQAGYSSMFIMVGDEVSVENLLKGIIISSGNDACIVLAEGMSGSEKNMVDEMNLKAKELG